MKQQSVGIVLCALLLTTFGHELLNRHHVAHSARIDHTQARSPLASRSNPSGNETCEWKCVPTDGGSANVTVHVNVTTHVVAVANLTAKIFVLVDVDANLIAVFNATAKIGIIVDLHTQSGIIVSVTGSWTTSETFAAFVNGQNLTALRNGKGQEFDQSNISEEISVKIEVALVLLGESSTSAKEALGVLVHYGVSLTVSLKEYWAVISSTLVSVRISLSTFVKQIEALAQLIAAIKGGVVLLLKFKVIFSLKVILTVESSFQIVEYIWKTLVAAGVNLEEAVGDCVSSTLIIIIELASLGGNSTYGVNGLINIIKSVVLFVHGKITIEVFIVALFKYYSTNNNNEKLGEEWTANIDGFLNLIKELKLTTSTKFQVLVKLFEDIKGNKWIENNVNISAIISILIESKQSVPLNAIVRILVALSAVIAIEIAVGQLLLYIIQLLAVHGGLFTILSLIPSLKIAASIVLNGSVSVLYQIIQSVTITKLLSGNLFDILSRLVVIGEILIALDIALKLAAIKWGLQVLLGRPLCIPFMKGILQVLLKALKSSECEQGVLSEGGIIGIGGSGITTSGSGEGNGSTSTESSGEASGSSPATATDGGSGGGVPEGNVTGGESSEERHAKASGKHHAEHKHVKGKHYSHEKHSAAV